MGSHKLPPRRNDRQTLALTTRHGDWLEFDEDRTVLGILSSKVFRRAINLDAELMLPPDMEKEAQDAVEGLDEATADLDTALSGMSEIDQALAAWKEELSVYGATPQDR